MRAKKLLTMAIEPILLSLRMKIRSQIAFVAISMLLILSILGLGIYSNGLKRVLKLEKNVQATWGDVKWRLEERNQSLPRLLAFARTHAPEREDLYGRTEATRNALIRLIQNGEPTDVIRTANELTALSTSIWPILESAPVIAENPDFQAIKNQAAAIENQIVLYQIQYNEAVTRLNRFLQGFPGHFMRKHHSAKPLFPLLSDADKSRIVSSAESKTQ